MKGRVPVKETYVTGQPSAVFSDLTPQELSLNLNVAFPADEPALLAMPVGTSLNENATAHMNLMPLASKVNALAEPATDLTPLVSNDLRALAGVDASATRAVVRSNASVVVHLGFMMAPSLDVGVGARAAWGSNRA